MHSKRRSFIVTSFWLLSCCLRLQCAATPWTWEDCSMYGAVGDSNIVVNVNCNNSHIKLDVDVPNSLIAEFLEYQCFEPYTNFSESASVQHPSSVLQSHPPYPYVQSTNSILPDGTMCTARGCYTNTQEFVFIFNIHTNCLLDIDECNTTNDNCGAHSFCNNTYGSYECICEPGYVNDTSLTCIDIDECNMTDCGEHGQCNNTDGSYFCDCDYGYVTNGIFCIDTDECNTTDCGYGQCENTDGSYYCDCDNGYVTNGTFCIDIDECNMTDCGEHGQCNNTDGSYFCDCYDGYVTNGTFCIDVCSTIDCGKHGHCENTDGSYECDCDDGYVTNGTFCIAKNVSSCDLNLCPKDAECDNTTYQCTCRPGYEGDGVNTCTKAEKDTIHLAVGLAVSLFALTVCVAVIVFICFIWRRRCTRTWRDYDQYKFDVQSKVDLSYDPGVLRIDTCFTVHSFMGSVIHQLNYEQDFPTTTVEERAANHDDVGTGDSVCSKSYDNSDGDDSKDTICDDERSNHASNEDEDSCTITAGTYYSNDTNTGSEGSQVLFLRQDSCAAGSSKFSGYVTEVGGGPSCGEDSGGVTDSVCSPLTHYSALCDNEEISLINCRDEAPETASSVYTGRLSSKGYISSELCPTTDSTTLGNRSPNSAQTPPHRSHESNPLDSKTVTPLHDSSLITRAAHSQQQLLKSSSELSLNVITDIDQAFPTQFLSNESLDVDYYPTPPGGPLTKSHSQSDVYCFTARTALESEYPDTADPPPVVRCNSSAYFRTVTSSNTATSRPFLHHTHGNSPRSTAAAPFAKTTQTVSSSRAGTSVTDTAHLSSSHTFIVNDDTPVPQTGGHCTLVRVSGHKSQDGYDGPLDTLERNATYEMNTTTTGTGPTEGDSPLNSTHSGYINLEETALLFSREQSCVVREECETVTAHAHGEKLHRRALSSECLGGDREQHFSYADQHHLHNAHNSSVETAPLFTMSDEDRGVGTHEDSGHQDTASLHVSGPDNPPSDVNTYTGGFHNILFSLNS